MSRRTCIDCGARYELDDEAAALAKRECRRGPSSYWCPECDCLRIRRITSNMEEILDRMQAAGAAGEE